MSAFPMNGRRAIASPCLEPTGMDLVASRERQ